MRLYLVRHGEAVAEEQAGSDRDRWLNARGREQVRGLAKLLRETGVVPALIVSSPLPRAVQTAELLGNGLDYLGELAVRRALEPSAQPRVMLNELLSLGTDIMVVGHEPNISALGALIVGLPSFQPFRTAQCCGFERQQPTFLARGDLMQVVAMHRE